MSFITVFPKHRRQRMTLLEAGFTITVCSATVDDLREDLRILDMDHRDLEIAPCPFEEGMVEVSLY